MVHFTKYFSLKKSRPFTLGGAPPSYGPGLLQEQYILEKPFHVFFSIKYGSSPFYSKVIDDFQR